MGDDFVDDFLKSLLISLFFFVQQFWELIQSFLHD